MKKNYELIQGFLNKTDNGWVIIHVDETYREREIPVIEEDAIKLIYEKDEGKELTFTVKTIAVGDDEFNVSDMDVAKIIS